MTGSPGMIRRLVEALTEADVEADAEAIADALWLARARRGGTEDRGQAAEPVNRPVSTEPRPPDAEPQRPADSAGTAIGAARVQRLDRPVTASQAAPGAYAPASSITFRRARELPAALELGRALRPLKQRHPSKRDLALDAEGTVEYFCDTGVLTPIMRPGAERWFDLDVLVDASPSMAVWQETGLELVSLLERHGAFREVRHWMLEQVEGKVRLSRAAGQRFQVSQLVDPTARRLTIVVTDCVGPMWYQAPIWDAIRQWGLFSPVVIATMMPSRLWAQTALRSPEVTMRSHQAGSANGRLDVTVPWWWSDDAPPRSAVPVPVITLEPSSVAAWARMVMGAGGVETAGVFAVPPLGDPAARPITSPPGAEERVQRFRVTVSPTAYRLAVYLSAALRGRWGLALARVVQDALLPDSRRVHLAEVIVGGLVRRADPDTATYEFVEGVADVLQRSLTVTEALQVLQALGGHLERESGRSPGIAAMLLGEAPPVDVATEFGEVRAGAAGLIRAMGMARPPDAEPRAGRQDAAITALAVLPDGRLAGGAADGQVMIWDLAQAGSTGAVELGRHGVTITALAVLADGRVATGAADGRILIWDPAAPGAGAEELGRHTTAVTALVPLPDRRLVSGAADGRVVLWTLSAEVSRPIVSRLQAEDGPAVTALAAVPDRWIAWGTGNGLLEVKDPSSDDSGFRRIESGHQGAAITALAELPDGRLASGAADGQLLVWDFIPGDRWPEIIQPGPELGRHDTAVTALAGLVDGRLASGTDDGQIWIWDPASAGSGGGVELGRHGTRVTALAGLPGGRLASGADDGQIQVWDPAHNGSVAAESGEEDVQAVPDQPPLERYLVMNRPLRVRPGSGVSVVVSVSTSAPTAPDALSVRLQDFDVAYDGMPVRVVAQVDAGLIPDGELSQTIQVPVEGGSEPTRFAFRAGEPGHVRGSIRAFAGGTYLASLDLEVTVEGASAGRAAGRDKVMLLVHADGPRYIFELRSQGSNITPVMVESSLEEARRVSLQVIDGLNQRLGRKWIEKLGARLWYDIIPDPIKDQFWRLRPGISSLAIGADLDIPWELLYPRGAADEGFMVEQFPVTRLVSGQEGSRRIGVSGITPVLLSPSPGARDEIAAIRRIAARPGLEAPVIEDRRALLDLLGTGQAGSLYFTGHGAVTTRLAEAEIAMTGGPLSPVALTSAFGQRALAANHPLVFVNTCRSSGERLESTGITAWAQQFMNAGAGAFVGTSWTVPSETARTFAEAFYRALGDGLTLGEAAWRARRAAGRDSEDPGWLAYAVFGDPAAVADLEPRPGPEVPGTPSTAARGGRSRGTTGTAPIVAVHGLGQQMSGPEVLRSAWLPSLRDGLARAGAEPVASEDLAIAFYGDLFRPVLDAGGQDDEQPLEEELVVPLWRAAATEKAISSTEPVSGLSGKGFVQWALRTLNTSRFFTGLSERAMVGDLRQLRSYLHEPALRQAVLDRVTNAVGPDTRVILAHSIGSIVAYEALCAHPEWDIRMFVTLGSPLGLRYVFDRLIPPPQDGIGSWPGNTRQWTNIADTDDIVALEKRLAPMFAGPVRDVLVNNGAHAHDLKPYLTANETGRAVAEGLADLLA